MEDSNYEKVFKQFQERFLKKDIDETARILHLKTDENYLYVPFFHKICRVKKDSGEIEGETEQKVSVTDRLTIMHHLCCYQQFAQDSDRKVPFREIREAAVFEAAYNRMALKPLKEAFQGKTEEFIRAGIKIGGKEEKFGDASVTLQAFPTISLTYIFWEGTVRCAGLATTTCVPRKRSWAPATGAAPSGSTSSCRSAVSSHYPSPSPSRRGR